MRFRDFRQWINKEPEADERAQLEADLNHPCLRAAWWLTAWPRRWFFPLMAGLALLVLFIACLAAGLLDPLLNHLYSRRNP